jgi:leucyl-tRNA synthetase
MAVPGQDQRDWDFARKYDLPIVRTVQPPEDFDGEAFVGEGSAINSGFLDGLGVEEAKRRMIEWLEEHGKGRAAVTYRLRDWLISRQRYWGTPIPIIYCDNCGTVPVPEEDLPVLLPEDAEFMPTGESPLKRDPDFYNTECPRCGGPATRETDTMDTFVDSSWYWYRYLSPHYGEGPWKPEKGEEWLPVDIYTGGIEHAILHLLYARFWTKAMRDLGLVDFSEPFNRLYNQGIILGEDAEKMSKSRGNVVNPQDYVDRYGSDALRDFLMFIGPWDQGGPWDGRGIEGVSRFLRRALSLTGDGNPSGAEADPTELARRTNRTVMKVTEDLETFRFNTAIAALMEHTNYLLAIKGEVGEEEWTEALRAFVLVLAPFAPHHAEEMWAAMGEPYSVHEQAWPAWDETLIRAEEITLVVQVNGKLRDRIEVPADITEEAAKELALSSAKVRVHVEGREIRKSVYVPGRLVNLVVS